MLDDKKLALIANLGNDLAQAKDLDLLLDRILADARRFAGADAGSIYLRRGDKLEFAYTQNDTLQAQLPPGRKLVYSTFTLPLDSTTISGHVAVTGCPLNIPDAYQLPPGVPYTFGRRFDERTGYRTRSLLTLPLKTHQGDLLGVLQLINARDREGKPAAFDPAEEPYLLHFANTAAMAIERANLTRSMIMRIIEMARLRDPKETGSHVKRVATYSVLLYEAWARGKGIPGPEMERNRDLLKIASMLHDVGKVAISDSILKKPARLEPAEFEVMKSHTWMGARLFADQLSEYDRASAEIALSHHEKWDGSGYPGPLDPASGEPVAGKAIAGDGIPLFGRIVAVADVFDALSSRRSYKQAWDEEAVVKELRSCAGTQFDPEMVEAFLFDLPAVQAVRERYPDSE